MDAILGSSADCPRKLIDITIRESAATDWNCPCHPGSTKESLSENGSLLISHWIKDRADKVAQYVARISRIQYVGRTNIANVYSCSKAWNDIDGEGCVKPVQSYTARRGDRLVCERVTQTRAYEGSDSTGTR